MVKLYSVEGNGQKLDGGAMFGNAPRALWERWLPSDDWGRIQLSCRAMLIVTSSFRILCETGVGCFFEPKLATRYGVTESDRHVLLDNLNKLGYDEGDIDYVILSHLHFDHVGGLLPSYKEIQAGKDTLLFPKAQYVVGANAWERSQNPHLRDKASFIPGLADKLWNSGRLHIVESCEAPEPIKEDLSFWETSGHTPGQLHTLVHGKDGKKAFFCGDLIPGTHWLHLPITMGYDRFPEGLIDEKKEVLGKALDEKWVLFYTHDPRYAASFCGYNEKKQIIPTESMESLKGYSI